MLLTRVKIKSKNRRFIRNYYRHIRKELKSILKIHDIHALHPFEVIQGCEKVLNTTFSGTEEEKFNQIFPLMTGRALGKIPYIDPSTSLEATTAKKIEKDNKNPEKIIQLFQKTEEKKDEYKIKIGKRPDFSKKADAKIRAFYKSYEWSKARYTILKKYGAKCMVCNAVPKDCRIHVDHIKPLRKYWSLRLDLENLQVFCEDCNYGKGNWDETDWRPKPKVNLARVMPE